MHEYAVGYWSCRFYIPFSSFAFPSLGKSVYFEVSVVLILMVYVI